jgi:DNA-binding beta-propeller fold protein YncE
MRLSMPWLVAVASAACTPGGPGGSAGHGSQVDTLYVTDVGAQELLRVDRVTGEVEVVVSGASLPVEAGPYGVAPAALGWWGDDLLVTNFLSGEVLAVSTEGQLLEVVFRPTRELPPLEEPVGLVWSGARLAVLGNDTRNVVLFEPHDATTASSLTEVPIRNGHGLVLVGDELVVGTSPHERDVGLLQRFDRRTGERLGTFAPWPELQEATHVALGPEGDLYVTDWFADRVLRYDAVTGEQLSVAVDDLDRPVAVAWAGDELLVLQAESLLAVSPDGERQVVVDGLVMGRAVLPEPVSTEY